jgi:hypothetical protein
MATLLVQPPSDAKSLAAIPKMCIPFDDFAYNRLFALAGYPDMSEPQTDSGAQVFVDIVDVPPRSVRIVNFAHLSQATWQVFGMLQVTGGDELVLSGHRINKTGSFTPLMSFDYD